MLKELKEAVFKGKHDDNDLSNKNIHKDINYFLKRTKCKFQVERITEMKISLEEFKSRSELTEEIIGRHGKTDQSRLANLKKKNKTERKLTQIQDL